MTTVRRVYGYLGAFVGLLLAVIGLVALIALIVDRGFDAFRDFMISSSAPALALIIVGGVTWRYFWRKGEREATASIDERSCGARKLYLYGVMTISLLSTLIITQLLLSEMLTRLLVTGWSGYKPWTPLLSAALLFAIWRWHDSIARLDRLANADGARGGDLQRGYWFSIAFFGVVLLINGLTSIASNLLMWLGNPTSTGGFGFGISPSSWAQIFIPPLTQAIVGWIALSLTWRPSQIAATAGDQIERSSKMRSILIHFAVLLAAIRVLGGAQLLLTDILGRLLRGSPRDLLVLSANGSLSWLIVGGLIAWYFFKFVRATLLNLRLSEYIIAGVAFFIGVAGVAGVVLAIFQFLGGYRTRIEELIVSLVPMLLIGAFWFWRWSLLQREIVTVTTSEPRNDLWRKVYLYLFQFGGLTLMLVGGVILLQSIVASILGQPSFAGFETTNFLYQLSGPLTALIVGFGLMVYLGRITGDDARLSGLTVEEMVRQTIGDHVPTWALFAIVYLIVGPLWVTVLLALLGPAIGNVFSNIYRNIP